VTDKIETFDDLLEACKKIGFKHDCFSSLFSLYQNMKGIIDIEIEVACGYENATGYVANSKDPQKIFNIIKALKDCEAQDDR